MALEPTLISGPNDLDVFLQGRTLGVVAFVEEWSDTSTAALDTLKDIISEPEAPKGVGLARVNAESFPEMCLAHKVTGVPTTILFQGKKEVFRVTGVRVRDLAAKLAIYAKIPLSAKVADPPKPEDVNERCKALINQDNVMLFMKGSPAEPQCGFSRTIVGILNEAGVKYSTFNILADNDIREGLKSFSNWRTYPQLYVKGQLIGGLDIIKELKDNGELLETLNG